MSEVKKSDIIYLQNEILKDMAALDKKLSDKITQLTQAFEINKLTTEQKLELSTDNFNFLLKKIESNEELKNIKNQFSEFKNDINQSQFINTSKISAIEKDLKNACYKYDNYFSNNIFTPGLIGNGAKYKDIKTFREYIDKKLAELILYKDKNIIDFKKYKEKNDKILSQIKIRTDDSEKKYFEFCYEKINEAKNEIMIKFSLLDESLNNLKIENGKYSFDLLKKSEDLQNQINDLKNIKDNINIRLNEQAEKYQNYNNDMVKLFQSQKDEFVLIKSRFTELSEFIKDVRFMRNLNNYSKGNQNKEINSISFLKDSRMLSKKLNFDKPQKLSRNDGIRYNIKTENENDKINDKEIIKENIKENNNNIINKEKEKNKEQNKDKIKYNIKTNYIDVKKIKVNSPQKNINNINNINKMNNISHENNFSINSNKKDKMNNTFISIIRTRNVHKKLIDDSAHNKTSRERFIENNKEDLIKNKSDLFFGKINKTEDNNKNKNLKLKIISKNFIKDNSYFDNYNNINKNPKDSELNLNEDGSNNIDINETLDKIYNFIDSQILKLNKKIKEMSEANKYNIEKMNRKLDLYININNVLLLKYKNPKNLSNKQINILTNNDYSIPLLSKTPDKKVLKIDRIKVKSKDNSSILNTKEIKNLNDSKDIKGNKDIIESKDKKDLIIDKEDNYQGLNANKILKKIEPYLIKKFRRDST